MHAFSLNAVTMAAEAAGLPRGRVVSLSKSDNLTIPRPRIELQWLPESFTRTGRKLGHTWNSGKATRNLKKELYTVKLDVSANVLTDDPAWLSAFVPAFIAALPKGANDTSGNWVLIRAEKAEWLNLPETRVGLDAIKVFSKAAQLVVISFTWRVANEELQHMITDITLEPAWKPYGEPHGR